MGSGSESQFITPPPGVEPVREPRAPVHSEPSRDDEIIDLPPGIIDSKTYQTSAPRVPKPANLDSVPAFFPGGIVRSAAVETEPPGPAVASVSDSQLVVEPSVGVSAAAVDHVDEATRFSPRRHGTPKWSLALPDGRELSLENTTIVGRDPAPVQRWPEANLLPFDDSAKSISKTHAALEIAAGGQLRVHDLNSTNGVYVQHPGSEEVVVPPGAPEIVEPDTILGFGEFTVTVKRH